MEEQRKVKKRNIIFVKNPELRKQTPEEKEQAVMEASKKISEKVDEMAEKIGKTVIDYDKWCLYHFEKDADISDTINAFQMCSISDRSFEMLRYIMLGRFSSQFMSDDVLEYQLRQLAEMTLSYRLPQLGLDITRPLDEQNVDREKFIIDLTFYLIYLDPFICHPRYQDLLESVVSDTVDKLFNNNKEE